LLQECRINNNQLKRDKLVEAYRAHQKSAKEVPAESAVELQAVASRQTPSEPESKASATITTHQVVAHRKQPQPPRHLFHNLLQLVKVPQTKICKRDLLI
jgi:hypothetical protein